MKKELLSVLVTWFFIFLVVGLVNADSTTQNFTNEWTAEWKYQYQPYSASTQSLESVELSINIVVSGMEVGDDFWCRASFFTGWEPVAYQFYIDELFENVANADLIIEKNYLFTSEADLDKWTNPLYGPNGHYYFESETLNNSHTVNVTTQLTYNYDAPTFTCVGYKSPLTDSRIKVKKNRALPVKAELFNENNFILTDSDIVSSPVIQVAYVSSIGEAEDVTDEAYAVGFGTDGNAFEYNEIEQVWQFNLKIKNYTFPGTYTITIKSGDETEYLIDTCEAQFVIN